MKSKSRSQNEIIKEIAALFGCTIAQARKYLISFAEIIATDLRLYGVMNIPQIRKFTKHIWAAHKGRNPKTGVQVQVPAQIRILFKARKQLTDKLSSSQPGAQKILR